MRSGKTGAVGAGSEAACEAWAADACSAKFDFWFCSVWISVLISSKKDILKVECDVNMLDLDVLGFIDHNITVNVIKNGDIVEKKELKLPKQIKNVIHCKNPRCITSIEQELPQIFVLADPNKEVYRCKYCEEKFDKQNL